MRFIGSIICCLPISQAALMGGAAWATQPTRLLWKAQGVENVVAITSIEDLDGDLTPDVVFESYDAGPSGVDHLFAINGRSQGTGDVIWSARPLGGPSNSFCAGGER